jgi:hypothetical protein
MKTPLKIDLLAELDKATTGKDLAPYQIRSEISRVFAQHARAAGWGFRSEIWPTLREAVEVSINSSPESGVMDYIEALRKYCV